MRESKLLQKIEIERTIINAKRRFAWEAIRLNWSDIDIENALEKLEISLSWNVELRLEIELIKTKKLNKYE